ncbi:MAG: hypothetical protein RI575_16670 [Balneolaceae bacterium]|nr:hypothetical protein [Balneolaceae bacterium]
MKRPVCSRGINGGIRKTPRRWVLKKLDWNRGVVQKMMNGFLSVGMEAGQLR